MTTGPVKNSLPPKKQSSAMEMEFKAQRSFSRFLAIQMAYAMDSKNQWECTDENFNAFLLLVDDTGNDSCKWELSQQSRTKAARRARRITDALCQCHGEIDELLKQAATNWTIERIHPVERNIMRVAAYEMKYDEKVSAATAINEALELAKMLGQGDSSRFINGVLDKIKSIIEASKGFVQS